MTSGDRRILVKAVLITVLSLAVFYLIGTFMLWQNSATDLHYKWLGKSMTVR